MIEQVHDTIERAGGMSEPAWAAVSRCGAPWLADRRFFTGDRRFINLKSSISWREDPIGDV
jgi:hypothetical protein